MILFLIQGRYLGTQLRAMMQAAQGRGNRRQALINLTRVVLKILGAQSAHAGGTAQKGRRAVERVIVAGDPRRFDRRYSSHHVEKNDMAEDGSGRPTVGLLDLLGYLLRSPGHRASRRRRIVGRVGVQ